MAWGHLEHRSLVGRHGDNEYQRSAALRRDLQSHTLALAPHMLCYYVPNHFLREASASCYRVGQPPLRTMAQGELRRLAQSWSSCPG